ncbi:hypothetical protein P5673_013403 [Acropora cervicornis]|uniref:Uncharacterized protein n=1 Tax=Acropora cervicornis TaxID=6130 RepID=A0AAD9QKM0_ACRCE|nr:hypothetical protein P5673_013403 [Acropora cervicornis]
MAGSLSYSISKPGYFLPLLNKLFTALKLVLQQQNHMLDMLSWQSMITWYQSPICIQSAHTTLVILDLFFLAGTVTSAAASDTQWLCLPNLNIKENVEHSQASSPPAKDSNFHCFQGFGSLKNSEIRLPQTCIQVLCNIKMLLQYSGLKIKLEGKDNMICFIEFQDPIFRHPLIPIFVPAIVVYEIFHYVFLGEGSGTKDSIQRPGNTEEFLQGEEFRSFQYQEVDENWIDHYSEGGHSLALR